MNIDMAMITENAIVVVPVLIAIVQAIKLTGWVRDHYSPLLSIVIGIGIAFLSYDQHASLGATIFMGAIYGLMASGLYSGVKTTMVAHARLKAQRSKSDEK